MYPLPPENEWDDDRPTVNEERKDTGPHDLTALARVSAIRGHDDVLRLAYGEGQEDAIRALYAVCRAHRLARDEIDNIVLDVRQRLTRL